MMYPLVHLKDDHTAETVRDELVATETLLSHALRRSLT